MDQSNSLCELFCQRGAVDWDAIYIPSLPTQIPNWNENPELAKFFLHLFDFNEAIKSHHAFQILFRKPSDSGHLYCPRTVPVKSTFLHPPPFPVFRRRPRMTPGICPSRTVAVADPLQYQSFRAFGP